MRDQCGEGGIRSAAAERLYGLTKIFLRTPSGAASLPTLSGMRNKKSRSLCGIYAVREGFDPPRRNGFKALQYLHKKIPQQMRHLCGEGGIRSAAAERL